MSRPHPNNRRRAAGGAALVLVAAACIVVAIVAVPGAVASPSVRGAGGRLRRRRQQGGQCVDPEQCVSSETGLCEDKFFCLADPCAMDPCADGEKCAANYCGGCHPVCTVAPQEAEEPVPVTEEPVPVILSEPFPEPDFPEESDPVPCAVGRDPEPCPASAFCKLTTGDCLTDAAVRRGECFFKSADMACIEMYAPVCGCDGNTYSNDCIATIAGVSVASRSPCAKDDPEPEVLGPSSPPYEKPRATCAVGSADAIAGLEVDVERCPAETFCKLSPGDCVTKIAFHYGECAAQSDMMCAMVEDPVCGCDGRTYSSECVADQAGVSIMHRRACVKENPGKPPVEGPGPEVEDPPTKEDEEDDVCATIPKYDCRRDPMCKYSDKKGVCFARGRDTNKPKRPNGKKKDKTKEPNKSEGSSEDEDVGM